MKMVKSLLLVSAAGIVATAGAQAADLPVKAKPVEYVKVCSLYGAGFYYIPGTDICLKVGGYVRYQVSWGIGNTISGGPFNGAGGYNNRTVDNDIAQRTRALATFDTRQQTAYGTLRTYLLMGFSQDTTAAPTTAPTVYMTRGFIQIAGFTFGKATSFFDFVSTAAVAYNAGMLHTPDTGDAGQIVAAYTAQLGNGVSASIAMEQTRRLPTVYAVGAQYNFPAVSIATGAVTLALPTSDNLGAGALPGVSMFPDIVANARIDQAWGSAQISGALHNVSANYYGAGPGGAGPFEANGHPGEKWGWALSPGLRLNAPMIAPGDYFQVAAVWAQGATKYAAGATPTGANQFYWKGNQLSMGFWEDGNYGGSVTAGTATGINLTTAWSIMGSYEHFWTPSLRTSLYGSYVKITHNAQGTAQICASGGAAAGNVNWGPDCDPNFSLWEIGSRSQWNVTKDFYVGFDVTYLYFNSAKFNAANTPVFLTLPGTAGASKSSNFYTTRNSDAVAVTWRVHRDFVP